MQRRHCWLILAVLFVVWLGLSLFLFLDGALAHAQSHKSLALWKSLLAFWALLVIPATALFFYRLKHGLILLASLILLVPLAGAAGGWPPLAFALRNHHSALSDWLIEQRITLDDHDAHGGNPLIYTAMQGNTRQMRLLFEQGAGKQKNILAEALQAACLYGHVEAITLLLQHGADINGFFASGKTPLMLAAENGQLAIVDFLLQKGAQVDHKNSKGQTAIDLAEAKAGQDNPAVREAFRHIAERLRQAATEQQRGFQRGH